MYRKQTFTKQTNNDKGTQIYQKYLEKQKKEMGKGWGKNEMGGRNTENGQRLGEERQGERDKEMEKNREEGVK